MRERSIFSPQRRRDAEENAEKMKILECFCFDRVRAQRKQRSRGLTPRDFVAPAHPISASSAFSGFDLSFFWVFSASSSASLRVGGEEKGGCTWAF